MTVYRINYTADGQNYFMMINAKDEKAAVKKCRKAFKEMKFSYVQIDSIETVN